MLAEASRCLKCTYLSCSRRMAGDSWQESSVQNSRMNWAIGHGSNGGRLARKFGYCRSRIRTNSLLQSQKLERSSRSSSGVKRSDENVVRVGVSVVVSATTDSRFFLADFMATLPREGSNDPVRRRRGEWIAPGAPARASIDRAPQTLRAPDEGPPTREP